MRANSRSSAAGFTLLEVLAALVIISLGMLAVIEAIGQTASNSTRMRDRTLAHWVAMNRLTAVRLEPRAPKIDKTSDEVEMAGRRWRWTMEVTETPVQSMRRIDVRVGEAEGDDERSLAQVTGFYGSAIAAAGTLSPAWQGAPTQGLPPGNDPGNAPGSDPANDPANGPGTEQPEEPPPTSDNDPPLDDEGVDPPLNEETRGE
jgi:general secretion pathway protein I